MSQTNDHNRLSVPISDCDHRHTQGAIDAPIVLVKYGNYQCPHSGEAHRIIPKIQQQLGNKIYFVYRHFPQTQIYPQSQKAAEAAEIAGAQGKFWQMHDTLFKCQNELNNGYLVEYAQQLGLNIPQFLRDMTNHAYADRVNQDWQSGVRNGVTDTPAFFINGDRYENACDFQNLLQTLLEAVKQTEQFTNKTP
ncbi:DsbA family protein [Anabaena sp. CCY 0017]|uniref:DsbA family protein n=1 Tax=Anabaena sp. CCY 0017 TaxID=3103866 RepID=UPI0039C5CC1D